MVVWERVPRRSLGWLLGYVRDVFIDCAGPDRPRVVANAEGRWHVHGTPAVRNLSRDTFGKRWTVTAYDEDVGYIVEEDRCENATTFSGGVLTLCVMAGQSSHRPWVMTLTLHPVFKDAILSLLPYIMVEVLCSLTPRPRLDAPFSLDNSDADAFEMVMESILGDAL